MLCTAIYICCSYLIVVQIIYDLKNVKSHKVWVIYEWDIELSMSETPDGEVDYGSFDSVANPNTGSDHAWSTSENDSLD